MNVPEWIQTYTDCLEHMVRTKPAEYGFPIGQAADIALKMTMTLIEGRPVCGLASSPAMKKAAKKFGITATSALRKALQDCPNGDAHGR